MSPRTRTVPRKAPQQQRSRETVDVILAATARVLVKEGFDHASTNRIAEAAGVSIGSLYQYFPSKESLVAALIERHFDEMFEVLSGEMERVADLPLPAALRSMVTLMLQAHAVDPALHRVLNEQVPRVGRLHRLHDVVGRMRTLGRAYFERHRDEMQVADLDVAAFITVQTIEALIHTAATRPEDAPAHDVLVDEVTALLVRYLQKPELTAAAALQPVQAWPDVSAANTRQKLPPPTLTIASGGKP
jgi:AcrR family transcriptional regulator